MHEVFPVQSSNEHRAFCISVRFEGVPVTVAWRSGNYYYDISVALSFVVNFGIMYMYEVSVKIVY